MAFYLSDRSMRNLQGVHPDLIKVPQRAIQITPYDFGIVEGVRLIRRQRWLFYKGLTETMASLHLRQDDGFAHAFDIVVYNEDGIDVYTLLKEKKITEGQMRGYFRKVIQAHFTAAIELGVQIEAGGLWRNFLDSPHIQLNQNYL